MRETEKAGCAMHDDGMSIEEYMQAVEKNVTDSIVHLQAVADRPPFVYTVGLADRGHPEVIVFGLPMNAAGAILNDVARRVVAGEVFKDGQTVSELANMPTAFRAVRPELIPDYFGVAIRRLGSEVFDAVQLVWPDTHGKFPWDEGFQDRFRSFQPDLWRQ